MIAAMNMAQVAMISATPINVDFTPPPVAIAMKAVRVTQVVSDSAKAISNCMEQIKPWYGHIKNYKPRFPL